MSTLQERNSLLFAAGNEIKSGDRVGNMTAEIKGPGQPG